MKLTGSVGRFRPQVDLDNAMVERCLDYGRMVVEGYAAGHNPASRAVSSHGAEYSVELQATARMAEAAFCQWARVDPLEALDWTPTCDAGFDVDLHGVRIDVKATSTGSRYLIWPYRKTHLFASKPFDALVLVKCFL